MNQKKVYIIHMWNGHPKDCWLPWLKNELEKKKFEVSIPAMPDTEKPKIEEWVNRLLSLAPDPDENTYFVGHSIGCQAILRYLEKLDNKKIGGIVFVAGWFTLTNLETEEEWKVANPWLKTPIDFEKIKNNINKIVAIFSDNDPFVPLNDNVKLFSEKLNAEIIIEKNKGHFTGEDGIFKLPIVLQELEKLLN